MHKDLDQYDLFSTSNEKDDEASLDEVKLNKKQNHEAAVFLKFYQRGIVEQDEDPCTLV